MDELFSQFAFGYELLREPLVGANSEQRSVVVPDSYGFCHRVRKMLGNPIVAFLAVATGRVVALYN